MHSRSGGARSSERVWQIEMLTPKRRRAAALQNLADIQGTLADAPVGGVRWPPVPGVETDGQFGVRRLLRPGRARSGRFNRSLA